MLRIIGGELRSRRLHTPPEAITRPTSGMVREALFNILQNRIAGARFLDLCAGSGAVGLEALSRGAAFCLFLESHVQAYKILCQNIAALNLSPLCATMRKALPQALSSLPAPPFDIVFIDPPYETALDLGLQCFTILQKQGLLAADGVFIMETAEKIPTVKLPIGSKVDSRRYGSTYLHLLTREVSA